mgnify:CR=1 FL=1
MRLARLGHEHTDWLRRLTEADPAQHVFLASLLELTGSAQVSSPAGTLWGVFDGESPVAAYWIGGSIISIAATPRTNVEVAHMLNSRGRSACSLIGDHRAVIDLHRRLRWGPARSVRADQPFMVADRSPRVAPAPAVRVGDLGDVSEAYAAAVEMFTEEVGFSPVEHGSAAYLGKVRANLSSGSTLLYTAECGPDGAPLSRWPAPNSARQVVFKADIGIRSRSAVQIQGVWVHPVFRGTGLAAPGMVAVTDHIRRTVAPIASLYVNAFNAPALRTYRSAGYSQTGRFATIIY